MRAALELAPRLADGAITGRTMRFLPKRPGWGKKGFVPLERVQALEAQLRNEVDRSSRYRYYLGVGGWEGRAARPEIPGVKVVTSPEELWAYARSLVNDPNDVSVLDVGSGVRPFSLRRYPIHVCVEPFEPYVEQLARRFGPVPSIVVIRGSAPETLRMFPDGAFDAVILADLIEHLTREAGRETIDNALRIARKHVHVFTPDGYMPIHVGPLDDDGWGYVGNEVQSHVSGWTVADFVGWRIIQCPAYHDRDGQTYGAIWATHVHPRPKAPLHASLFVADPFDPSDAWTAWLAALEERMTFCQATIHPELAPWSFRTRPMPRLPGAPPTVALDAVDLVPSGHHRFAYECEVCGARGPARSLVVLRNPDDIEAALDRAKAKKILVILENTNLGTGRGGRQGLRRYRVVAMSDTSAIGESLDWLLNG